MLDLYGLLIVIGLLMLTAMLLMILVRPYSGRPRYRRVGLGQTAPRQTSRPEPASTDARPGQEPEETRKAETA
jgi:hypothetical protein